MVQRTSPLRMPFPRRFILRLHYDLFKIDRHIDQWAEYHGPLTLFEKMVLASEDRRFFRHNGIDYISVSRDALKLITFRRHGGASTVDMQLVRTITGYYEKTFKRKAYEMLLAALIQFRYSKIEILRSYLKHAFFGSHLYGADKASRAIFQKSAAELDMVEAAMLASMLIYPRPQIPTQRWEANVRRRSGYIQTILPRFEKSFEKLPRWEGV